MKSTVPIRMLAGILLATFLASGSPHAAAADPAAADTLATDSKCFKCHSVDRKKDGPAFRDVAAKFRGDPQAEAKLIQHVTNGEKVKFPDGHEENHKRVKTTDMAQIKNLVQWIESLEGGTKY